jgi:hypothetical protein
MAFVATVVLAVELALLEEDVEELSADAGDELDERCQHAGHERNAAPLDVRARSRRQQFDNERHHAEGQIDHRLVRNECDGTHRQKGRKGPGDIQPENPPAGVSAPQDRTPAIRGQLNGREQHHARDDVEKQKQHAEQDHASRHAENAGNERRAEDRARDDQQGSERQRTHATRSLPSGRAGQCAVDHIDRVLDAISRNE